MHAVSVGASLPPHLLQAAFGKCDEPWMVSFCQQTCKRCPCAGGSAVSGSATATSSAPSPSPASNSPTASSSCSCSDVPPGRFWCKDEAAWSKCGAAYMQPTAKLPEGCRGGGMVGARAGVQPS